MLVKLQGYFSQFQQKTGHTMRFPDGSDVQLVPDNSMMTYGVLIEPAGLGRGSLRWVWTSASCLRTDEENEWGAERRSGCNHSLEVSLQADKHHSKTEMREMKEREQRKEKMKHERDDSDAQRQSRTLRASAFGENTNFQFEDCQHLCQLNKMVYYRYTDFTLIDFRLCLMNVYIFQFTCLWEYYSAFENRWVMS